MALKGIKTKSDFLEWDRLQLLILQLERDGDHQFRLLISIGCYTGLRISDILGLTWEKLYKKRAFNITEKKTKKTRSIQIHPDLLDIVERLYYDEPLDEYIFINRYKTQPITVQYVNRKLKQIFSYYNIQGQYSSHFMRKTLGRRVWEKHNHSEKSLFMLSQLFNHSSIQITKIYLGIREEEIQNIYLSL